MINVPLGKAGYRESKIQSQKISGLTTESRITIVTLPLPVNILITDGTVGELSQSTTSADVSREKCAVRSTTATRGESFSAHGGTTTGSPSLLRSRSY